MHKILLIAVGVITAIMGVMIFVYPPSIFPDPSHGFQVMRSMQMGGGFNNLITPDQDNISNNASQFLTWWSPGQYLVPYSIKIISGLNTGRAIAIAITLFELSGLAGFYVFFKKLGFTSNIAALSIVFIVSQQAFIAPYVFYNGGEVLLFGFEGWFLYGCASVTKADIKLLLFVLLSGWMGFFCKSSFLWIYAAGLVCICLRLSSVGNKLNIPRLFKNGIWIAIPAILSLACIYIFFLSKGQSPASASNGIKLSWQTLGFPLASPLVSGFSVDDIMHGMLYPTFSPMFTPEHIILVLILMALISLVLIICIIRYVPKDNYRLFIIVFYLVSILFFSVAYLRQLTISYEGRHFRIIGLLIVPGIIYLVSKLKVRYQLVFGVLCMVLIFINYSFLIKGYIFNKNIGARGSSGISQEYIDQSSLNYILNLDQQNKNAIFVFVTADLSLEIVHNRIITLDPPLPGSKFDYNDYMYNGHAGPLYMILPTAYAGERANIVMKFFPGYPAFAKKQLGAKYILYSAK